MPSCWVSFSVRYDGTDGFMMTDEGRAGLAVGLLLFGSNPNSGLRSDWNVLLQTAKPSAKDPQSDSTRVCLIQIQIGKE